MADKKPIGEVTHYYGKIGVAVVKFFKAVKVGDEVQFKGIHTDFNQTISSMQFDHKSIEGAKKGDEVGMKVDEHIKEGDQVFEV